MRIRLWQVVLAAVLTFASCGKREVPRGILPPEKMEDVMWDMLLADEFLKEFMLKNDTLQHDTAALAQKAYDKVFHFNKISRDDFAKSFEYYRKHPAKFSVILDSLNKKGEQPLPVTDTAGSAAKPVPPEKPVVDTPLSVDTSLHHTLRNDTARPRKQRKPLLPQQ